MYAYPAMIELANIWQQSTLRNTYNQPLSFPLSGTDSLKLRLRLAWQHSSHEKGLVRLALKPWKHN